MAKPHEPMPRDPRRLRLHLPPRWQQHPYPFRQHYGAHPKAMEAGNGALRSQRIVHKKRAAFPRFLFALDSHSLDLLQPLGNQKRFLREIEIHPTGTGCYHANLDLSCTTCEERPKKRRSHAPSLAPLFRKTRLWQITPQTYSTGRIVASKVLRTTIRRMQRSRKPKRRTEATRLKYTSRTSSIALHTSRGKVSAKWFSGIEAVFTRVGAIPTQCRLHLDGGMGDSQLGETRFHRRTQLSTLANREVRIAENVR